MILKSGMPIWKKGYGHNDPNGERGGDGCINVAIVGARIPGAKVNDIRERRNEWQY